MGVVLIGTGVALHHIYGFDDDDRNILENCMHFGRRQVPFLQGISFVRFDLEV